MHIKAAGLPRSATNFDQYAIECKQQNPIAMKFLLVVVAVFGYAAAAAVGGPDAEATVLKSEFDNTGFEGFKYAYETSNGISHESEGHVVNAGSEKEAIAVSGSFKYTGADGVTYTVNYVADENGYQPHVSH